MMYQIMTVMAKPCEILEFVIFSIFVDMVDRKDASIGSITMHTTLRNIGPAQGSTIGAFACGEVFMVRSNIELVTPVGLAAFTTEELSTP
jgi:hypothetical protein